MTTPATDWNPEAYARFRGLRLRPALDLLAQVGDLPDGPVVDLGCGDGAVGAALALRWPGRVVGVDASDAMLAKARQTGAYARLDRADIADWHPDTPPALIFSNAALHWLPGHEVLMPRLLGYLSAGGTLAVQMPRNHLQPSHRFLRDIAAAMFPDRFVAAPYEPPVSPVTAYIEALLPRAEVSGWETEYTQHLAPVPLGHPVRAFTESTAMRPFLDKLTPDEAAAFAAAYDEALAVAYPALADGSVVFPFRRVFFTARV